MKVKYIFYLMIILIMSSCGAKNKEVKHPEVGAWQLFYSKYVRADTIVFEILGDVTGTDVKVWSGKYFISVGRFKEDTTYVDNYVGGSYTLNGNNYEEHIQYHVNKKYVGKTVKMIMEFKGDTLIQTWPVDKNGQIDSKNYVREKYVKIKTKFQRPQV